MPGVRRARVEARSTALLAQSGMTCQVIQLGPPAPNDRGGSTRPETPIYTGGCWMESLRTQPSDQAIARQARGRTVIRVHLPRTVVVPGSGLVVIDGVRHEVLGDPVAGADDTTLPVYVVRL